ncbi:MAG: hypothetical protein KAT91_00075 [Candidatus Aenigmarchaeota archaeon]|nr:hypothetical protein [Candidatus Aenigmarchaeota archaeon]
MDKNHKAVIRHDIDVSLKMSLEIAEIEKKLDIHATYMVMTNSLLYSLEEKESKTSILQLIKSGHEIGLHFDSSQIDSNDSDIIQHEIRKDCKKLEKITNCKVLSISFHRPTPAFLRGPLKIDGRINAYGKELMFWYLSDSRGRWIAGEPLPKVSNPDKLMLQILIHPIWWGKKHETAKKRLEDYFDKKSNGLSPTKKKKLIEDVFRTIDMRLKN